MPTRAVKADRLVREYRDEVGREVGRLVKLAKNLRVPREKAIEILADVPYKLSIEEAEARLRQLDGVIGDCGILYFQISGILN